MLGLSEALPVLFLLEDHHYLLCHITQNSLKLHFTKAH